MNVKAVFGEDDVVLAFFPERGSQAHVEFVRFAESCAGICVVAQRVARLNSLNQSPKDRIQVGDVLDVEELAARLVHHLANVDQPGNHGWRRAEFAAGCSRGF